MCKRLFKALKIKMDNFHLRYELAGADEEIARLREENEEFEKALNLAVEELDDAKDMLRDCGKNEWASLLNTSADYFKTKAKGEK